MQVSRLFFFVILFFSNGAIADDGGFFLGSRAKQPDREVRAFLEKQDACWTSGVPDPYCKTVGAGAEIIIPRKGYYFRGRLKYMRSQSETPNGKIGIESNRTRLAIGSRIQLTRDVSALVEAAYLVENNVERVKRKWEGGREVGYKYGRNPNFNSGYGLRGEVQWRLTDQFTVGGSAEYQRYQNCSDATCHSLKTSHGKMSNVEGRIFIRKKIPGTRYSIQYTLMKNLDEPDRDRYNGIDRDVGHELSLNYNIDQ